MVGSRYGVEWTDNYHATDDSKGAPTASQRQEARLSEELPGYLRRDRDREVLGPGEHPFPTRHAVRTSVLTIDPAVHLEALRCDVIANGGHIVARTFATLHEVATVDETLIVNATGLGARALVGDTTLVPVKGQLTVLAPQPEVTYRVSARLKGGVIVGMHPRRDGIVLGNLADRGNWSLEPDEQVRHWMVESAVKFFSAMRPS